MKPVIRRGYVNGLYGQIHYRCIGRSDKPVLVLLHQAPSSSAMYEKLMTQLADRFYVIAPDLSGFGQSDALPHKVSVKALSDDIAIALVALAPQGYSLFGHHSGAAVAAQLTADHPETVKRLAMSGPTLLTPELKEILPTKATPFELSEQGDHWQGMWQRIRGKDSNAPIELSQRESLLAFTCGDNYLAIYQAVADHNFAELLPRISCPCLVYAGDNDVLKNSVAPTRALLADSKTVALPVGSNTYVCEHHADAVAKILINFFKS